MTTIKNRTSSVPVEGDLTNIPSLAPLIIKGVDTTNGRGVVPQALLLAPLKVLVPAWDTPVVGEPAHTLSLFWLSHDGERLLARLQVTAPPPPILDFYEVEIKLADLRSATRVAELYYSVDTEGGTNSMRPSIPITIDLDPPRLLRPTDVLQFVVPPSPALNEQYIVDHPQTAFIIPPYNIQAPYDWVEFYLSNLQDPPQNLAAAGRALVDFTTQPPTASLDAAAFRKLNDGAAHIFFRIYDATGNFSVPRSLGLPFKVNLLGTTTPTRPLPAPEIGHSLNKNGYLTCSSTPSFMAGVSWLIAPHAGIREGDEVRFVWQGFNENNWATENLNAVFRTSLRWTSTHAQKGATVIVDSFDTTLFPLRNFASASGSYEVWRDGKRVGESLPGYLRVDLTYGTGFYCSPRGKVRG